MMLEERLQGKREEISTRYAERGADLIRRAALVPGAPPPDPQTTLLDNGWTPAKIAELQASLHCLNYGNPKYLAAHHRLE